MQNYTYNEKNENKDRLKSGILTAVIWSGILFFIFWYKVVQVLPEKKEVETRMLINFGDNTNGSGAEEPANQEGSLAALASSEITDNQPAQTENNQNDALISPIKPQPEAKNPEKVLSGRNEKVSVKSSEKTEKPTKNSAQKTSTKSASRAAKSSAKSANSKTGTANGDGKGNAAVGNLLKGKGTKTGSQGDGSGTGNAGDPLGGEGNGDSKIGIDRKLVSFIPGTMGRGGAKPASQCDASGKIVISYTVDKSGNVVSAHRSGGISDACAVSTAVSWVRRYVKAERASTSSTGTYTIVF